VALKYHLRVCDDNMSSSHTYFMIHANEEIFSMKAKKFVGLLFQLMILISLISVIPAAAASTDRGAAVRSTPVFEAPKPKVINNVAFDRSANVRELARRYEARVGALAADEDEPIDLNPDRGPLVPDDGYSGDGALQGNQPLRASAPAIASPTLTFEGLSNENNRTLFGFRVNPPDPVGDVGRNHYVEMVNLAFAVYNKQGALLLGPVPIGALWEGFAVTDCTDPSGDPIVLYDQFTDRWLLSQFTTLGPTYYNCIAISQTGDPTGAYYRYAFSSGEFFPDYPKYGVWDTAYLLTSRDFGPTVEYGISVYALERQKMIFGDPRARAVQFFLDSAVIPIHLMGDGLLPVDIDGSRVPRSGAPAVIVGTQDDDGPYGAPFDALNVWEMNFRWTNPMGTAFLALVAQIPVAEFDSAFPCAPTSARDCLPQPGITETTRYLDILSYRQRPTWRLAYRNFGRYESMVTAQSVEARPGIAGMRWYELRRAGGVFSLHQQGTFAPDDGVHRWMGSIAQDKKGNMALGYSVVNGVDVYPGIRYTGRTAASPFGQMDLGEGTIMVGTGSQLTTNSRWGDYTSMNVDPVDDCTFWYVNEYYAITELAAWQTRIGSFKLPGCQ
jgi:hypothetical protein